MLELKEKKIKRNAHNRCARKYPTSGRVQPHNAFRHFCFRIANAVTFIKYNSLVGESLVMIYVQSRNGGNLPGYFK